MIGMGFKPEPLGSKEWDDLEAADPQEVCARAHVRYDPTPRVYLIPFLGRQYVASLDSRLIGGPDQDSLVQDVEFLLLLLVYLLRAQDVPVSGRWVSEQELPGGAAFFTGPYALPVQALAARFGNDAPAFRAACTARGGVPVPESGATACHFQALPNIPLRCVLRPADGESEATVSWRFDTSIESQLPIDVILALTRCVVTALLDG